MESFGWIITDDLLNPNTDNGMSRVGVNSGNWEKLDKTKQEKFRYSDDNDIVYDEGMLVDNDACDGQEDALNFCMADAGCVLIEVFRDGKWETDI